MRVQAGSDFVSYIRWIRQFRPLSVPPETHNFVEYDFHAFDSVARMRGEVFRRNAEVSFSCIVAGYTWEWKIKRDQNAFEIEIGPTRLHWNSTPTDWIPSSNALEEMGSIHTVQ